MFMEVFLTDVISGANSTISSVSDVLIPQSTSEIGFALWTGIIGGVVAGIITAVFLWLCRLVFVKSIQPRIADLLYRDAEIAGRWKAEFSYASMDEHRVDEFVNKVRNNERHRIMRFLNKAADEAKSQKGEDLTEKEVNPAPTEKKTKPEVKQKKISVKNNKPNHEFAITLKRRGHNISGSMLCTKGSNEGRHYMLEGTFKNLILTAAYESTDKSEIERGTITLMLKNNGRCLNGYLVALSDEDHDLSSARTNWIKK